MALNRVVVYARDTVNLSFDLMDGTFTLHAVLRVKEIKKGSATIELERGWVDERTATEHTFKLVPE